MSSWSVVVSLTHGDCESVGSDYTVRKAVVLELVDDSAVNGSNYCCRRHKRSCRSIPKGFTTCRGTLFLWDRKKAWAELRYAPVGSTRVALGACTEQLALNRSFAGPCCCCWLLLALYLIRSTGTRTEESDLLLACCQAVFAAQQEGRV